jgi:hypothetical protein
MKFLEKIKQFYRIYLKCLDNETFDKNIQKVLHIFVDFLNRQNSLRIFHVCWVVVDKLRRSFERNNHGVQARNLNKASTGMIRKSEQGVNERDNNVIIKL